MPPTFFFFIALVIYFWLSLITLIISLPMLLIDSKKIFAKKVLVTVLISFPCLIVTGIFWTIIFLIPAFLFFWFINQNYISEIPKITLAVLGFFTFLITVSTTALYVWYFICKIIYQKIDTKPVSDFIENDRVYNFLRPYLIKLKLYRPIS